MEFIDSAPDTETKLSVIETLRTVTEGKIFVEVERARVTKILSGMPARALAPGVALDLTRTGPYVGLPWDFDKPEKRQRARRLFR